MKKLFSKCILINKWYYKTIVLIIGARMRTPIARPGGPPARRVLLSTMLSRVDPGSLEMGNCFTSEPQECVQCIVKVRDQETQTQRRPDRRTLGVPRNEANEKRAEHYRQRKGLAI